MCGRYYIDDETAREIEKLVQQVDERLRERQRKEDICPTKAAPVLCAGKIGLAAEEMKWGFPNFSGKGVIFNARSETALEKKMFREGMLHQRCIIPAAWFYEWDHNKNKITFLKENGSVLYLAGFHRKFEGEERFVILTTAANTSMKQVHDRMPLILEKEEIRDWVFEDDKFGDLLYKIPCTLGKRQEYEQQTLFQ